MAWYVVEIDGQHELIFLRENRPPFLGDDGYVHLPYGARDSDLVDAPANLNRLIAEGRLPQRGERHAAPTE